MKKHSLLKSMLTLVFCTILIQSYATVYTIGTGTTQSTSTSATPFSNAVSDARRQYIIKASELTALGAHFSNISSLAFNVGTTFNTNALNSFNIKIKHTTATILTSTTDDVGLTTVYSGNVSITATGWKTFAFTSNFFWNGTDNILVEVCYNNTATSGTSTSIIATTNLVQYAQYVTGTASSIGCNLGPAATTVNTRPNMQLNLLAVNCSGAPTPGTISGVYSFCMTPGSAFTLTLNNYQLADGINRKWYSAPSASGPWTFITGATTTTVTTSITQTSYFICSSICTNTNDSSATSAFLVSAIPHYNCVCTGTNNTATFNVTNWTLKGISNSSVCNTSDWTDYRGLTPVSAILSSTANFSITISDCNSLSTQYNYFYGTIDYNHNGVFENSELFLYQRKDIFPGTVNTITGSFAIPPTALTGLTGMRIGRDVNCQDLIDDHVGETEEYLINIQPQTPCNGTPAVGILTGTDSICASTTFTLIHQIYNPNAGVSYQWQVAALTGNFSNISSATNQYQVSTMLNVSSRYRLRAVCNATNDTAYTAEKTILKGNWINCYCIPNGHNTGGPNNLVRVTLNELDTAFVSSADHVGYAMVNSPVANIYKGVSNQLSYIAQGSFIWGALVYVYIDYNHNGVFDTNENIGNNSADDVLTPWYIDFTIPNTALDGLTRMRVKIVRTGPGVPCGDGSNSSSNTDSQTGDFLVNINQPPAPTLNLKMYFTGLYSNGSLAPSMYNSGSCPNPSMCDTVIIELHNPTSPYGIAYTDIGLLDVSGNVSLSFPVAAFGNSYYIAVKHRNSLETWSKNPVTLYPALKSFDFTR